MILGMRSNAAVPLILAVFFILSGVSPAWSAGPKKILVLPFHLAEGNSDRELQSFGDHVNRSLRATISAMGENFKVESESSTDQALNGVAIPVTDQAAQAIAAKIGADLVVYGFLSVEDSKYRMRGAMWDMRSGRMIVATDLKVSNIHELPGVLQLFVNTISKRLQTAPRLPFYKADPPYSGALGSRIPTPVPPPRNTGPWRSPEIASTLLAVDIGDLDGDKKNETVFVEDGGITISRFEDGGLRPLTQFSEPPDVYLSAEVEDIDGDGVAELLLCYQTPAGIESSVIKYTNRKLKIMAKFSGLILRSVREPGDDKQRTLLGQRMDVDDIFSGEMIRFSVEGGEIKPTGKTKLPPGTLLLSYVGGPLGKSNQFLRAILNQDRRLMLFDQDNKLLAEQADQLYGSDKKIRLPMRSGMKEITFPGTLLMADAKGDGDTELLVAVQRNGSSFVQALGWDGHQLVDQWKTIRSAGTISDFRIRDFKNEGMKSLVLLLVKHQFLPLAPRSVVFAYDLVP
jgi:TolB-like protein